MRRLKVYLDTSVTSVISHLMQEDVPAKMADTLQLWELFRKGILTPKSYDDCQHIGAAVVNECDCIISWNFKHIVNIKTIRGVRAITNLKGYRPIEILNPSVLLESGE